MGWFLTWPHCDVTKEECLEHLKKKGELKEYVVCLEKHADGASHLHAFAKYSKKIYWKS